jgi:uncharacterized protein
MQAATPHTASSLVSDKSRLPAMTAGSALTTSGQSSNLASRGLADLVEQGLAEDVDPLSMLPAAGLESSPLQKLVGEALEGDPCAQYELGNALYDGGYEGIEVPEDVTKAVYWWRLAAEQGVDGAQYQLGCAYSNGEGVPEDIVQAYMWFRLSWTWVSGLPCTDFISPSADQQCMSLAKQMTRAQVSEARRRASQWVEKRAA